MQGRLQFLNADTELPVATEAAEEKVSRQIAEASLPVKYEQEKIAYIWPERNSTYTPDFQLGAFVETKGIWSVEDRQKHHLIRERHPDLDIRLVFSNQNARLYKGSPTTYAAYCDKHGFKYANRTIPEEWLNEAKEIDD